MKRILTAITFLTLLTGITYADLTGDGYYRVRNYGSNRWASLISNTADIDITATMVDLYSLQLSMDTEATLSDAASIVYIESEGGNKYDLAAQGTSLEAMVGYTVNIRENGNANGQKLYRLYGTYNGVTKYIGEYNDSETDVLGKATTDKVASQYQQWYIMPVNASTDNYFGAVPDVTAGGKQYTTLFTSFAYKPVSGNVKAYFIGRVGFGMAEMIEINGAVPAGSPVIIQCQGKKASDNKLELLGSQTALANNSLSGAYFDFYYSKNLNNRTLYDPETMRVLGVCSDGSLGFITATDLVSIPANTAYLKVPRGSAPEFKCVSSAQYEEGIPLAPNQITISASEPDAAGNMELYPQDEYTYSATLDFPATSQLSLLFEATMKDGNVTTLGAFNNVSQNLDVTKAQVLPFQYGSQAPWIVKNWGGGEITIMINLQYQYINFTYAQAGVESIITDSGDIMYQNGVVSCPGAKGISLFNLTGQKIASTDGESFATFQLPKGLYIVTAQGKSRKILVE